MGERKVVNRYFPPDFDPSELPKAKRVRSEEKQMKVRMMLPMSVRCNTCGTYLYKGTKFTTRMEDVKGERYLGLKIFRFYYRCKHCSAEFCMRTDPEHADYVVEAGATRNYDPWKEKEALEAEEARAKEERDKADAISSLGARAEEARREMRMLDELDAAKRRNAAVEAQGGADAALRAILAARHDEKREERTRAQRGPGPGPPGGDAADLGGASFLDLLEPEDEEAVRKAFAEQVRMRGLARKGEGGRPRGDGAGGEAGSRPGSARGGGVQAGSRPGSAMGGGVQAGSRPGSAMGGGVQAGSRPGGAGGASIFPADNQEGPASRPPPPAPSSAAPVSRPGSGRGTRDALARFAAAHEDEEDEEEEEEEGKEGGEGAERGAGEEKDKVERTGAEGGGTVRAALAGPSRPSADRDGSRDAPSSAPSASRSPTASPSPSSSPPSSPRPPPALPPPLVAPPPARPAAARAFGGSGFGRARLVARKANAKPEGGGDKVGAAAREGSAPAGPTAAASPAGAGAAPASPASSEGGLGALAGYGSSSSGGEE